MRVELTQDVSHLLTKGNEYEAEEEGGFYRIRISTDMLVPVGMAREVKATVAGVDLQQGDHYTVLVRSHGRSGKMQTLRGWKLMSVRKDTWSGILHLKFRKAGSRWGGVTREVDGDRIVSIERVEGPS